MARVSVRGGGLARLAGQWLTGRRGPGGGLYFIHFIHRHGKGLGTCPEERVKGRLVGAVAALDGGVDANLPHPEAPSRCRQLRQPIYTSYQDSVLLVRSAGLRKVRSACPACDLLQWRKCTPYAQHCMCPGRLVVREKQVAAECNA